jgi:hypothetical protein
MRALWRLSALMTDRYFRFFLSWVSDVVVVGVWVALIWPIWGVGPDRALFWGLVLPPVVSLALYEAFFAVLRLRGVDVRAQKRAVREATAAEIRRRAERRDAI